MLIITAVGSDKPGMAHAVAQILFDGGCNIEDTTMTRLSGQFSMILAVAPPQNASIEELGQQLKALRDSHGLKVDITPVSDEKFATSESPRYLVTAYGPENTGLLAHLTGILAEQGVNVTDVQTRVAQKGTVYIMLLEVELPSNAAPEELEKKLKEGSPSLQVSLRPLEEETL